MRQQSKIVISEKFIRHKKKKSVNVLVLSLLLLILLPFTILLYVFSILIQFLVHKVLRKKRERLKNDSAPMKYKFELCSLSDYPVLVKELTKDVPQFIKDSTEKKINKLFFIQSTEEIPELKDKYFTRYILFRDLLILVEKVHITSSFSDFFLAYLDSRTGVYVRFSDRILDPHINSKIENNSIKLTAEYNPFKYLSDENMKTENVNAEWNNGMMIEKEFTITYNE